MKLPQTPRNQEAENALLGCLMRDNRQIHEVALTLTHEDFSTKANQYVFEGLTELAIQRGVPADPVNLAEWLKERGVVSDVGYGHLVELWNEAAAVGKVESYAAVIASKSLARLLMNTAHDILRKIEEGNGADEILLEAQKVLFDAGVARERVSVYTVHEATAEALRLVEQRTIRDEGFTTGLADLDQLIRLRDGELTIIGARPGVGKTALAVNMFYQMTCIERQPALFVSLEQGFGEVGKRLLCLHSEVDGYRVRMGWLHAEEREQLARGHKELTHALGWIKDAPNLTMLQIMAEARRRRAREGLRAVFVDYLQLVAPENRKEQRYIQVGQISRRLKWMARELKVPVVAMCQVGRAGDKDEPRLSHLRESGDIEADADVVILLHEPNPTDAGFRNPTTTIDAIVAKQRDGPTGKVRLVFERKYLKFNSLAKDIT